MIPMMSQFVIWESTKELFETQLFSGSARAKAVIRMPTVNKEGRIINFLLASGVFNQRISKPMGPSDAPIKEPIKTAFEVSRSLLR